MRNDLSSHEKPWRNPECIGLSEGRQPEKAADCMIPAIRHSGKDKTMETVKGSVVARGLGGGGRHEHAEHRAFLGQ